jgi:hypothetical protein
MQRLPSVSIKFIIITEHISFIPNNILNACAIIPINKPNKMNIIEMVKRIEMNVEKNQKTESFTKRISNGRQKITSIEILKEIDTDLLLNLKEIPSFSLVKTVEELPSDVFNVICDKIINDIDNIDNIAFTEFRDSLYDIMIYNLDVVECLWYIISHYTEIGRFKEEECSKILEKIYPFLQYFNNNYRPIYHLENIMFYIINILKNETYVLQRSTESSRNRRKKSESDRCQKGIS